MYRFVWLIFSLSLLVLPFASSVSPEARIVGGTEVDIVRHPYLVSVRYRIAQAQGYYHECGGVIYTERVVITGAQCIKGLIESDRVMIVAGARTRNGTDGQLYPVTKWMHHPNFDYYSVDYDIGLFIVDVPFELTKNGLRAIDIIETRPGNGSIATVAGWGYREEWGPSTPTLEETQVPIVSDVDCTKAYGEGEITERMICAGDLAKGGRDACQGDTGGPLLVKGVLVGLVSWGRGCARVGYPTVYTYVPSLKQWIDETIDANLNSQ